MLQLYILCLYLLAWQVFIYSPVQTLSKNGLTQPQLLNKLSLQLVTLTRMSFPCSRGATGISCTCCYNRAAGLWAEVGSSLLSALSCSVIFNSLVCNSTALCVYLCLCICWQSLTKVLMWFVLWLCARAPQSRSRSNTVTKIFRHEKP